jgi:hypothetical protein
MKPHTLTLSHTHTHSLTHTHTHTHTLTLSLTHKHTLLIRPRFRGMLQVRLHCSRDKLKD